MTLLDALRLKEITLLIVSFLVRETHNRYILIDQSLIADQTILMMYYQIGAIVGLLLTGLIADLFLKKQRWLLLLFMNVLLLLWDFYLFWQPAQNDDDILFSLLVSMFMTGNDLVYLILIPMLVARRLQLNVAQVSRFKVSFSGTITGIVLSFCLAGKFLISQNLATILYYATQKSHVWA